MDNSGFMADLYGARVDAAPSVREGPVLSGKYSAECYDPDGNLKWSDETTNIVVLVGRNQTLDANFSTSAYTVTGPFMGLISGSTAVPTLSSADTMGSHAGWNECGTGSTTFNPTYTAPRKTSTFSAAASGVKAQNGANAFAITSSGIVSGAFLVYGTGAVSTIQDANGVLFSAGLFTGSSRTVANGDTLNVSYQVSLSTV